MSASEFIFISNIPNQVSPLTLMTDINNSYAKMAYFDSPDFKGNRQAFVFYPEPDSGQWAKVMERLNSKDQVKPSYVWYPEINKEYIDNVPEGVEVLPYIYVENLPKEVDFHHVVYGLPHIVNLRFMDVTYKDDKWAFIYIGPNIDPQLRRNLVMGLRSKSFNGYPVYASEMMVSKTSEFPKKDTLRNPELKPDMMDETPTNAGNAFRSEFLFLYNVPQPLGHGKILHFIKSMGIKFARIFFIETAEHLKRGFLHLPALSEDSWGSIVEALRSNYFHVPGLPDNCGERIDIEEVWFQPHGASPPPKKDEGEFLLTDYYFVYNIPRGVSEQLLVHGCGLNRIRVQLFDPTTTEMNHTRIGFAVRLPSAPDRKSVEDALNVIRKKRFGESAVYVDRIWRYRISDPERELVSKIALPPRKMLLPYDNGDGEMTDVDMPREEICSHLKSPVAYLSKASLFFIHGIPSTYPDTSLFGDVNVARSAGLASPNNDKRCCFVQPTYLDRHSWCSALATIYLHITEEKLGAEINEIFKEDGDVYGDIPEFQSSSQRHFLFLGMVPSCFLLLSNLPLDVNEEAVSEDVPNVEEVHFLLPNTVSDRSAIILMNSSNDGEVKETVKKLASKQLRGRRPNIQRLWLSTVVGSQLWPSYRAPCQSCSDEDIADKETDADLGSDGPQVIDEEAEHEDMDVIPSSGAGDLPDSNGRSSSVERSDFNCVVVEGLPLLINDSSVSTILGGMLTSSNDAFCVITSPAGQYNRLLIFAASQEEAQKLLREIVPVLKKNYRHRALLSHVSSSQDADEIIPVPEDVAFRMGSTQLLLYGLPRNALANVRSKIRELAGNQLISIDLKSVGKKFLGHGIVSAKDWQSCNLLYRQLQGVKIGNFEIKIKFLAK